MNFYKHYINIGSQSALASFAFFILLYILDVNPIGNYTILGIWIPIVFIVRGTRFYRDKLNDGLLTYWKGVSVGAIFSIFSASLFTFLFYIFVKVIDMSILDNHIIETQEAGQKYIEIFVKDEEIADLAYAQLVEEVSKIDLISLTQSLFFSKLSGGIFISLITSAFLRKTIILEPVNNQGSTTENNEHE
ncbi:MAG: DUF4199 domain-containing protein [Bacteroidota bacterium]